MSTLPIAAATGMLDIIQKYDVSPSPAAELVGRWRNNFMERRGGFA
jgi:hypothetical protein